MKVVGRRIAIIVLCLSGWSAAQTDHTTTAGKPSHVQPLTAPERDAVREAIADEIYSNDLQGYVPDVGKQSGNDEYEETIYFKPTLNESGEGWAIYKFMPYGQVLRMFTMRSDGTAILFGKLSDHFPPTEPSYLTVYMDDDELCQLEHQWDREKFVVDLHPSTQRVEEARNRQQQREQ